MSRRTRTARTAPAVLAALLATLAAAGVASAAATAPVVANGSWTGTSSQHQAITISVRSHIATAVSGTVTLTPMAGAAASACPPRKFTAKVNIPVNGPQKSTRAGFDFAISGTADVSGQFTTARTLTGRIEFDGDPSTDPCTADASFTARPR